MYSKHTIAERIVDKLFFKHKYLISSIVTPEDTVVEAAKILTEAVTTNSKCTESGKMVLLKQLAKVIKKIAEKKQEVVYNQPKTC